MTATRVVVTAASLEWARVAGTTATGNASSVIGCDVEAAIESELCSSDSPDGRPGVNLLYFAFSRAALEKALVNRIGQCILTCPTTACYNSLPCSKDKRIRIGGNLRFFGDGHQMSKKLGERRFWRIPVMDGEFLVEDYFGTTKGVAGGNLLLIGHDPDSTLQAATQAANAIRNVPGVIMPFPGGIVRSGSKVGSRYKKLKASTNDAYCPTLRGVVESAIPPGAECVYEIVMDGLDLACVEAGMKAGINAAREAGIHTITAGNYGGKLGPYHLHLHKLMTA